MAFQPGLPGSQFPSDDALIRRIQDLERSVRELSAANPFTPMGMKPIPGGVEIKGTLSLPAGIINNDALATPVTGIVVSGEASGFALTGGTPPPGVLITKTVTVPSGFTKALVMASADMTAVNPTATADYAYAWVKIAGGTPTYMPGNYTLPGKFAYVGSSFARILTGLSGSFDIVVEANADTVPWAADGTNVANLSAMVTFLR